ncbi:MAG TPA: penicillin-binding protein 2 [Candidatus Moranbacteria bacterium]|nr:penicillin-binding protein 2 [Candidatus Moranbacteria bacterium]
MASKDLRNSRCKISDYSEIRIYLLFFIIFFFSSLIIFRLYNLQILSRDYYISLAEGQHSIFANLIPKRGEIFLKDKEGVYPVAVNKNTKMAFAVPREIEDFRSTAEILAKVLGLDEAELKDKLDNPEDMYEVLKHRLNDYEISDLNNLKLKGVHLSDESFRYYPGGELASQALGFVGWRENSFGGRYGIENYFDKELGGQEGKLFQNKDNSGKWIPTGKKEITLAKDGDNLVLTIDRVIQYGAEKILKSAVKKFEADRGTIIVMDPPTGKILALASYPFFDPNNYQSEDLEKFRNIAISDSYECGSVFKTITLASAIDDGKISPDTTFTDTGTVNEAGYAIKNSDLKAYGKQTMTQVLEKSLNTGAIYAQKLLGNNNFSDYVKRFGFGEITGIGLPGESAGNISNLKNVKSDINFFTASFGQGISVTPIQLVSAYNAIASGGTLMKPQIVEKIIHADGSVDEIQPEEVRKVISQSAVGQISQILESVVVNGHGKRAGVPGYKVGGKTGTAQIASREKKGYEEGKNIGSFAGFAPLDNPQFTILVRMDNPKAVEWAESSAAPTFGELMKFLLDYKNIKPTEKYTEKDLNIFRQTHNLNEFYINSEKEEREKEKKDERAKP